VEKAVSAGVQVIDSAEATAEAAVRLFNGRATVSGGDAGSSEPVVRCFATDSVEKFERLGSGFLGRPTGKVELVDLGG